MVAIAPNLLIAGRFLLRQPIARGGMGAVWAADHVELKAPCALKFIEHGGVGADGAFRRRFVREARALARLRSPHIVQVFDAGDWQGLPYIAMELLEGETLAGRLKRSGPLSAALAVEIAAQVARALAVVHGAGVVHRDVKPSNLFLTNEGGRPLVKIVDFGIAKYDGSDDRGTLTGTHEVLGTPCYMSPEQCWGAKEVDHRTDLWSLAVVVFECMTGQRPLRGSDVRYIMGQIGAGRLPLPSSVRGDLPEAFDRWWVRATEYDPAHRFESAQEMVEQLALALLPGAAGVGELLSPVGEARAETLPPREEPRAPSLGEAGEAVASGPSGALGQGPGLAGGEVLTRDVVHAARNVAPLGADSSASGAGPGPGSSGAPGPATREGALAGPRHFEDRTPPAGTHNPRQPDRGRVKILFIEANALNDRPLRLNDEYRAIMAKLRASRHRDAFELLPPCLAARAEDLQSALLEHEPHVVHVAGHGAEGAELMLLDERGRPAPVSTATLASLFRTLRGDVRLVVFNACFSAEHAAAVGELVGLAVGMRGEVSDRGARGFAAAFYEALGYGRSVRAAFELGVTAVEVANAAQGSAPRLVERSKGGAARVSFVKPPWWRHGLTPALLLELAVGSAIALALMSKSFWAPPLDPAAPGAPSSQTPLPASVSAHPPLGSPPELGLQPVMPSPSVPLPAPSASPPGLPPAASSSSLDSAPGMIFIEGARIEIGSVDVAARPSECKADGGAEDCKKGTCPGWGRSVDVASFWLDATEVTNEDFARWLEGRRGDWHLAQGGSGVVLTNASLPVPLAMVGNSCGGGLVSKAGHMRAGPGDERRPAVCVTWHGANDYCRAMGKRMPSSAEWELAAKGLQYRPFPWGAGHPPRGGVAVGGRAGGLTGPREVATSPFDRTPEGVYDLGGNVAEWANDDDGAGRKVLRGGSWHSTNLCNLSSSGTALQPAKIYAPDIGFRCASDAIRRPEAARRSGD